MAERVFTLPDLGEGLEEAIVSAWLVAEGETVSLNQPFVEIETAKATVEVPAPFAGRVARLHVGVGETLAVGAPLVTFEVVGGDGTGTRHAGSSSPGASVRPRVIGGDGSPSSAPARPSVAATPAVRKLAKDLGVDLSMVSGSGPGGRITREDVETFARSGVRASSYPATPPDAEPAMAWTVGSDTPIEEVPVSPIRRAVAERLTEVAAIPQVTTFRTVECTALDAVRRDIGVSPLPVFVRALAEIVRDHPMLNATWTDRAILVHGKVNVGVATDTHRGLIVPVVMDAGSLAIGEIAAEIERLARAARDGSLKPTNTSGETIAVTNTGSYGSEFGTPLLNPGHAVTIALGVIEPRALVVDGSVQARPACTLSLTFDHRVLDGATVGRAFGALVELLESRERLDALPR
jgi:pyruvate/2-oxoglutarate dehydrogenase complex dihydrolipoamide acyltransferase (E2) component